MIVEIRRPDEDELERLRDIEVAAGAVFADVGLPEIAAHEPLPVAELEGYRVDGRAWVLLEDGVLAGYLLADVVDGHAHVEQVSVHPAHARRGHGARLMAHAAHWATRRKHVCVTLTTFRDVPWNAPYYERLGYRILEAHELGPELRQLMAVEADHGLDPARRVAMRLDTPWAREFGQDHRS